MNRLFPLLHPDLLDLTDVEAMETETDSGRITRPAHDEL